MFGMCYKEIERRKWGDWDFFDLKGYNMIIFGVNKLRIKIENNIYIVSRELLNFGINILRNICIFFFISYYLI